MLEELRIADFALIDEVLIEFGLGLNVLTGETGAGKTILLSALSLLLGDRADMSNIRSGASEARVEGRFRFADGEEVVLTRVVSREGRSKCYANGALVHVAELTRIGEMFVDLHGQHQHQALLHRGSHLDYLDRFCGTRHMSRRKKYSETLDRFREVRQQTLDFETLAADRERRRELLRFQVEEIDRAQLRLREEEDLSASLEMLRHADRLASAAGGARDLLAGEEESRALDAMRAATVELRAVSGIHAALDETAGRLESATYELEEIARELREYGETIEYDPAALAEAENRAAFLADLKRKYGASVEEVLAFGEEGRAELGRLESVAGERAGMKEERAGLERELDSLACELRKARRAAATRFEDEVSRQLATVGMGKARLGVNLRPRDGSNAEPYGATGADDVDFMFSPNAGEAHKPLTKIASGGEISRVMLALKVVLGRADDIPTLVFDEIDAGISGKTAAAVGAKLAELAADRQVICVTHLAQIAAAAGRHFRVGKAEVGARTTTHVAVLDEERRVEEIARLLSGAKISETSLKHAREMLVGS